MRKVHPAQILARRYSGCQYILWGDTYDSLEWIDPARKKPTEVEFWDHELSVAKELKKEEQAGDPDRSSWPDVVRPNKKAG